jgi:hypothetical protein
MATRMNMLKLLQEVEGFAAFPALRSPARPNPLLLDMRSFRFRPFKAPARSIIRISMQEPLDVGQPVPIRLLTS